MDLSDGCSHCHSEWDLVVLAGHPDSVPDHLIRSIPSDAHDHWSSEQWQFLCRRFAPRLVSLVRTGEIDPGLTLRAFGPTYADLANWPDDERGATEDALGAALVDALEHWQSHDLVELLGGLACAYDDLRPWLARLDTARPTAQGGVIRLACHWATGLLWGDDDWFRWWYTDDPVTPVREWTLGAKTTVERFSRAHPECKTARDALIAYDRLDRGEDSPWYYPGHAWDRWERQGLPGRYGWLRPSDQDG
ncbi:hypothetical protein ACFYOT_19575 [Saccharothrix saharensis]|uniref:hypothetical protein n=1 Tax=Saccharothrix saharensis TaxID=571190 RepID=UPI0036CBDEAD